MATNPPIFAQAIGSAAPYAEQVGDLAARLDRLRDVDVDFDDVVTHLEDDAIMKFDAAWDHLADELRHTLTRHALTQREELPDG